MTNKSFIYSSLLMTLAASQILCDQDVTDPSCGETQTSSWSPRRLTARHIEGKGVGYNVGYSTLEGFLAPEEPYKQSWVPFLDVRGHIFDNRKWAANGGIGLRYLTNTRVWGINGYYDYRDTSRQRYNQVSLGFESLGKIWDFRLNGYLPVSTTHSSWFRTRFFQFQGHQLIIDHKREFALKSINAEAAAHVDTYKNTPLYFAAGPYYLTGEGKTAWGGKLRASLQIFDYVKLEASTSYDTLFKWIGQGEISLTMPFGNKRKVTKKGSPSCSTALALASRALQPVDRNEIIPLDRKKVREVALNPATGNPWNFVFVNNLSHSLGTYESPYPDLPTAQLNSNPGDIIYLYAGSGAAYDVSSTGGFSMQTGQKLWGSGIEHPLDTQWGFVTIPSMSANLPLVTNSGGTVVTMANNCEVAGIYISGLGIGGNGIVAANSSNNSYYSISNNIISGFGMGSYGIDIYNQSGTGNTFTMTGNLIAGFDVASTAIFAHNDNGNNNTYFISGNTVSGITQSFGIDTFNFGGNNNSFFVTNNQVSNFVNNSSGIFTRTSGGMSSSFSITGNTISSFSGSNMIGIDMQNNTNSSVSITGNTIVDFSGVGNLGISAVNSGTSLNLVLIDNFATSAPTSLQNHSGTFTLDACLDNQPCPMNTGPMPIIGGCTIDSQQCGP